MITAENVKYLSAVPVKHLEAIGKNSGYNDCRYQTAQFLGLTNGGQWCYAVTWVEDGEVHKGKVFLSYNPDEDKVTLDF